MPSYTVIPQQSLKKTESQAILKYIRSISVTNKRTANEYLGRLLVFETFIKESYNFSVDELTISKTFTVDIYDLLSNYVAWLNNRTDKDGSKLLSNVSIKNRIINVKNFLVADLRHNQDEAGFFTASMGSIEIKVLREGETIEGGPRKFYPATLLGNMGVENKFREQGLGRLICDICVGLAKTLSKRVGCRYVYLWTTKSKIEFYKKCGFIPTDKISGERKLWMYKRIIAKHVTRAIIDNVTESSVVTSHKIITRTATDYVPIGDIASATKNPKESD